jgi:tRNA nucleotidyltransferase (CCA-adding enzyme)
MEIITSHTNADFDTIASMLAAKKLYPDAIIVFPGSLEKGLKDSFDKLSFPYPVKKAKDIDLDKVERLIIVDIKQAGRIGRFEDIIGKPDLDIHIYDHHPPTPDDIKGSLNLTQQYGSTTTILTSIIKNRGLTLTSDEATILMLGIYEDTGSLSYPSTTTKDYEAAAFLLSCNADLNRVADLLKRELSPKEVSILNDLIQSSINYNICGVDILIAETSVEGYTGEIAILAHKLIEIEGVNCLFVLLGMKDRVHMVVRNRLKEVNAGEVARDLGGGGHPTAASATLKGVTLIQAKEKLLEVLNRHISPKKVAKDIMSTPVITVNSSTTIAGTKEILIRYNINALPVVKEDGKRCVGVATRQIIEKAIHHDLGNLLVEEYMSSDFDTVEPETSVDNIRGKLIGHGQRLLPVVYKEEIRGVITRTDLLRLYHEEVVESPYRGVEEREEHLKRHRNVKKTMKERLPGWVLDILTDAGNVAESLDFKAYVVGGFVRDMILRYENLDIDIVIEGDGIEFAKEFAASKGCRVKSHERFGTAVIVFPDGFKVDVATARLEYYERPGALPTVELSSLKLDLFRRDFTINTLAVELDTNRFGELIDFFGAQKDIKEKTVRVLHNLSFIEDPTRVFRAVRFSERYGFKIAEHTKKLIKNAVRIEVFKNLAGERMLDELVSILEEETVIDALKRLKDIGLLRFFHPKITLDRKGLAVIDKASGVLSWYRLLYKERTIEGWMVLLLAFTDPLNHTELIDVSRRLAIAGRLQTIVMTARSEGLKALKIISERKAIKNSEIYRLLKPIPLEVQLYLIARTDLDHAKKVLSLYISNLSGVKTILNGNNLKKMGVPEAPICGEILGILLDMRLNNEIKTKDEEIAFVKEILKTRSN